MRGYVYVALNDGCQYLLDSSALSVRKYDTNAHITVFTDIPHRIDKRLYDNVILIPHKDGDPSLVNMPQYPDQGIIAKVKYLYKTEYDTAIFLDYDVTIADDITSIFDLMERGNFDIVLAHSQGDEVPYFQDIPVSMPKFNLGIIGYRRNERTDAFMRLWWQYFYELSARGIGCGDEPTLTRALFDSKDIRYCTLQQEYDFRFIFLALARGKAKVFHGRGDMDKIISQVNSTHEFRVIGSGEILATYEPYVGLVRR